MFEKKHIVKIIILVEYNVNFRIQACTLYTYILYNLRVWITISH